MNKSLFIKKTVSLVALVALLGGCAQTAQQTNVGDKTKSGAAIGAAAGAILGNIIGKDTKGTLIGATLGTAIGGAIGYNMDKQAAEIAKSLETEVNTSPNAEATSDEDIIVTKNDRFVKITFRDKMMFPTNSAVLTPAARYKIDKLIGVLQNYPQTILQVVGHTDNRGTHAYNQNLSVERARGVANLIVSSGIQNPVYEKGCSFDKPVAPNTSSANMDLNRRVEVFLYPNQDFVVNQCI
ncbi:MAG: OmpA family protein [Epsilonproteobacteria bacterium]|nr:OmpA family protein [Campylobacterota bacterium]